MKEVVRIVSVFSVLLVSSLTFGQQNQDYIPWTGKATDGNGHFLINQTINAQVALKFGSGNSDIQYIENHTTSTDSKGSFNLKIGGGNVLVGNFKELPWVSKRSFAEITVNGNRIGIFEIHKNRNFDKFKNPNINNDVKPGYKGAQLKTNITPLFSIKLGNDVINAGEGILFFGKNHNYTINTKDKVTLTAGEGLEVTGAYPNYRIEIKKHYIGEHYLGGIIFWLDESKQHGLIAKEYNEHEKYSFNYLRGTWATFPWEPSTSMQQYYTLKFDDPGLKKVNALGTQIGSGEYNTNIMVSHDEFNNKIHDIGEPSSIPEILISKNYFGQWYLPSSNELYLIYKQRIVLKDIIQIKSENHIFWSSTEGEDIWASHGDGPKGEDLKSGEKLKVKFPNPVLLKQKIFKVGPEEIYTGRPGALAIDFFTGETLNIAKYYTYPFVLIRNF